MTDLSVRNVTKSFGSTRVLKGIDLHVEHGSFTAVLGPSGCGKTTLLRLVAGFADPDVGSIKFGDEVVFDDKTSIPPQHRKVGYVPQEGALFPHLNVSANITFGLPRKGRRSQERVSELLELVGLDQQVRKRYPHQLSGGQQQRVALARALAPNPSLVLLDEPFASLDAGLRGVTGRAVAKTLKEAGITAVLVTHDQDEALSLADQVAVMREGRLVQVGDPRSVYQLPVDEGVAEFVGAAVILEARIEGKRASTDLGEIDLVVQPQEGEHRVMVRPEQLRLLRPTVTQGVPARVTEVSYFGHDAFVHLELETRILVLARVMGAEAPAVNSPVRVVVEGPATVFSSRSAAI